LVSAICAEHGSNAAMQTCETTEALEARRCRYAQYAGQPKTVTVGGSTITGIVRSVMEVAACTPTKWIIKIAAS
jgi:hypothetical protein